MELGQLWRHSPSSSQPPSHKVFPPGTTRKLLKRLALSLSRLKLHSKTINKVFPKEIKSNKDDESLLLWLVVIWVVLNEMTISLNDVMKKIHFFLDTYRWWLRRLNWKIWGGLTSRDHKMTKSTFVSMQFMSYSKFINSDFDFSHTSVFFWK